MSGVDVLAVMERAIISRPNVAIKRAIEGRPGLARDLIEARDTVAELIETAHAIADKGFISASRLKNLRAALAAIGPQP